MCFPVSLATSSALIDFGRPTNSGITMCGNTTTSRNGSSGKGVSAVDSVGRSLPMAVQYPSKSFIFPHLPLIRMDAGKAKVGSTNGLFKPSGHAASARDIPLLLYVSARQSRADRDRLRMSRRDLGRFGEHQQWLAVVGNCRFVDDDTRKVGLRRQVIHYVEQ